MAKAIGGGTTFESLVYRVQAAWYLSSGTPSSKDIMSYKGAGQGIPAQVSPKAAFDSLFYGFDVPSDPGQSAEVDFARRTRASVIDLVRDNTERLTKRLGGADKRRMEQHLDELRDLEKRIHALPPEAQGSCKLPTDPGADPPLGGAQQVGAGEVVNYNTNSGYSGEKERAVVFCDLIQMAFSCDLSRASSLMITYAQSHLNMFPITGLKGDVHDITHNGVPGGSESVAKVMAWHMSVFAYLVAKLRDTPEGSGSLLDSCALVMLHEGGHGYDPASGKQWASHSTENMACSIAGGAGGLKRGYHVVAKDKHPANVLVTLMNAVGVPDTQLGEVKGALPELLG